MSNIDVEKFASIAPDATFGIHIRPADILADVRGQRVQETLRANFVAHGANLADIVLHAAQDGETVHDYSPLFNWRQYRIPLLTAVCQEDGRARDDRSGCWKRPRMVTLRPAHGWGLFTTTAPGGASLFSHGRRTVGIGGLQRGDRSSDMKGENSSPKPGRRP
ncbi:mll3761 [Mesorhizobium japonicum MAFF 303099]|uniref:Mll3761 protein n=1 Tax=Mesorhizobium japonicum (strain LMG 29417 / CECT 9101 / MAFF 303099) TaxID=266835 RepID=Q98FI6_RHILO|nr:mll3761 [Mesorhizobium japonicum MAFF 303099]